MPPPVLPPRLMVTATELDTAAEVDRAPDLSFVTYVFGPYGATTVDSRLRATVAAGPTFTPVWRTVLYPHVARSGVRVVVPMSADAGTVGTVRLRIPETSGAGEVVSETLDVADDDVVFEWAHQLDPWQHDPTTELVVEVARVSGSGNLYAGMPYGAVLSPSAGAPKGHPTEIRIALGTALERDTALALNKKAAGVTRVTVGVALETDTALPITRQSAPTTPLGFWDGANWTTKVY